MTTPRTIKTTTAGKTTSAIARRLTRGGVRALLFASFLASFLAVGCAHGLPANAIAFKVNCNVEDATVWIDDTLVGTAKDWKGEGRHIRAGFHRIEVRHPGYYSFFQEVELPAGNQVTVNARLRELIE